MRKNHCHSGKNSRKRERSPSKWKKDKKLLQEERKINLKVEKKTKKDLKNYFRGRKKSPSKLNKDINTFAGAETFPSKLKKGIKTLPKKKKTTFKVEEINDNFAGGETDQL